MEERRPFYLSNGNDPGGRPLALRELTEGEAEKYNDHMARLGLPSLRWFAGPVQTLPSVRVFVPGTAAACDTWDDDCAIAERADEPIGVRAAGIVLGAEWRPYKGGRVSVVLTTCDADGLDWVADWLRFWVDMYGGEGHDNARGAAACRIASERLHAAADLLRG